MNIHQRIHAIMKDISYVKKGGVNKFLNYKFTSHDDVTRLVRGQLVEHGVVAIPTVKSHSKSDKQEKNGVAILTEVNVSIDFVNIDDPSDKITVDGFGYGIDKNDLGPGKALSYACKMIYLKTFALETGEKDNEVTADPNNAPAEKPKNDPEQVALFNKIGSAMKAAKDPQELQRIWQDFHGSIKSLPEVAQTELEAYRVSHTTHLMQESAADPFPGDMDG